MLVFRRQEWHHPTCKKPSSSNPQRSVERVTSRRSSQSA